MENEEDLTKIFISDIPYITYKQFIEEWILEGSDELKYFSPYKSIPTWLIIDRTYHNYRDYCKNDKFLSVMHDIDKAVEYIQCIETRIRKRLFLFSYSYEYITIEPEFINLRDDQWYFQNYDLESNKIKTKRKNKLIKTNIFSKTYSHDILEMIRYRFTFPLNEIYEIIYLLRIVGLIVSFGKNKDLDKYEHPELRDLNNMFPKLEINDWLCLWSYNCL